MPASMDGPIVRETVAMFGADRQAALLAEPGNVRCARFARSVGRKEGRLDASVTRARNVQWALAGP